MIFRAGTLPAQITEMESIKSSFSEPIFGKGMRRSTFQ